MVQTLLVGLVAGVAAALLFVAPFGGTLVAAVAGAAGVFALAQSTGALTFALFFAIPIGWATAVATQTRPAPTGKAWQPAGIVLANAAVAVALGVIAMGLVVGFDPPALTREITA